MLDLKSFSEGVVLGGTQGRGVDFVDCVFADKGKSGQLQFRVKVASKLHGKVKDPERDDDFDNIEEDFVDVYEWVPDSTSDKYKNSLSRFNKTLSHLSGVAIDPEDEEAWMSAVVDEGELNKGIKANLVNMYVTITQKDGYYNARFVQSNELPKKPKTIEEFKANFLKRRQTTAPAF
jgi:hypothetical protein